MEKTFPLTDLKIDTKRLLSLTHFFSSYPGTILLFSGSKMDSAKKSLLFLFPVESFSILHKKNGAFSSYRSHPNEKRVIVEGESSWDLLKKRLTLFEKSVIPYEWVGYFSYEMGYDADLNVQLEQEVGRLPLAYFQKSALTLEVKEEKARLFVKGDVSSLSYEERKWIEVLSDEKGWKELIQSIDKNGKEKEEKRAKPEMHQIDKKSYLRKIDQIQELIRKGEVYQVNLSHEMKMENEISSFSLFERTMRINPAPFSAYLALEEYAIVSSSPERLLKKERNKLETRPIKGTAPRGKTAKEDQKNLEYLTTSLKEKAELVMITDLMRNDVTKVSKPLSTEVKKLFHVESYTNVFHMLSIIESEVMDKIHPVDVIRSCFPGGSITGCPKIRSMEIIAEKEKRPRGIYTGSIGYFTESGDFDFNIAIRTLLVDKETLSLQVGGAITIDSDPEKEYEETYHKARSFLKVLEGDN